MITTLGSGPQSVSIGERAKLFNSRSVIDVLAEEIGVDFGRELWDILMSFE